jgi:hypothetical protein
MIENIRKYTGLMMVTLVVLFFSFIFLDSSSIRSGLSGGRGVIKIDDRTYNDKEYKSLGTSAYELTGGLMQSGEFGLYQFMMQLTAGATSREDAPEKFFVSRMILRHAKDEFGVHPSDSQIDSYLKAMHVFADPDGKFNQQTYQNYITNGIGRLGLTENDLRELASDVIAAKKINEIVGSGLTVDRDSVAKNLALDNQRISGELARLDLSPFEEKIHPTEEQIKTYWETIQDSFTTPVRRKFTYVIVSPAVTVDSPEKDVPESIADATASEDVKKAAQKKKDETHAKRAAAIADERRKKQLETDAKVDDFMFKLEEQKGAGFEALAKENGWEVKTSKLFAADAVPKDLDVTLRASGKGGKAVEDLFKINETSDPFSKISEAIAIGENQWLVARLDTLEKSRPKTFVEARDEARAQYISEKAAEAMKKAADDDITKIKAAIAGGKSFTDAAKDAGIKEVNAFKDVISTTRPDGVTEPQNLFASAKVIDPGSIANAIIESDRAFILYVAKREVVKEPDATKRLDTEVASKTAENQTIAFVAWMNARIDAASVEQLYKR